MQNAAFIAPRDVFPSKIKFMGSMIVDHKTCNEVNTQTALGE